MISENCLSNILLCTVGFDSFDADGDEDEERTERFVRHFVFVLYSIMWMVFPISNKYNRLSGSLTTFSFWYVYRVEGSADTLVSVKYFKPILYAHGWMSLNGKSYVNDVGNNSSSSISRLGYHSNTGISINRNIEQIYRGRSQTQIKWALWCSC